MHTSFLTLSHSDRYMTWHCSWKKISCSSILFTPTSIYITHKAKGRRQSWHDFTKREKEISCACKLFFCTIFLRLKAGFEYFPLMDMAVHNIPPVQKSNHAWEIFNRSSSVQLRALGLSKPGNWSNTQRTSKDANPTHQSTNSVAIWVGFVSFKLVQSTYMFSAT